MNQRRYKMPSTNTRSLKEGFLVNGNFWFNLEFGRNKFTILLQKLPLVITTNMTVQAGIMRIISIIELANIGQDMKLLVITRIKESS